jgi:glycosyltransferase involved in cell wall biosynthesis
MKILCFTNNYPTEEHPTYGCFVREQVEDLQSLGVEVGVHAFDGREDRMNYVRAGRELRRVVREEDFDLVHAHYGLTGAVALMQRRVPVITTFHGSETGYVPWQRWVSWWVARLTRPLFVSERGARALRRPRADVVPCGVDTERFRPLARAEARAALGLAQEHRYVLFPGDPRKRVKRFDLFQEAYESARRRAPDLRAVWLEDVPREQVALLMNAVDATMMTSDSEGSPVTVRESLACATPVVSVPVGDVETVLSDLPGCAVVDRDAALLADALHAALDADRNPVLRARAELTSRQRTAERLVQLYEDALRRAPERGGARGPRPAPGSAPSTDATPT